MAVCFNRPRIILRARFVLPRSLFFLTALGFGVLVLHTLHLWLDFSKCHVLSHYEERSNLLRLIPRKIVWFSSVSIIMRTLQR